MTARRIVDDEGARKRDLAAIHIAKAGLGWDDGFYRDILWTVCRVKSSAELDFTGRKRLLEHLRACGWKGARSAGKRTLASDPQSKMIRGLWLELHELGYVDDASETALAAWVKRETGVQALQWLNPKQRGVTIEKLKYWRHRAEAKLAMLAASLFELGLVPSARPDELAQLYFGTPRLTREIAVRLLARLEAAR
jgi:phage gp16-like protein